MYDRFNRKIDYLRISVTDRCDLRCTYCMPEEGVPKKRHEDILPFEAVIRIVSEAARLGFRKVRLTGGEPLVRRGIVSLVREIKGVPGIEEAALTTNAILLPEFAEELREAGLDRVNISLDTLDPEKYRRITRIGDISKALAGIEAARAAAFSPIKINMVLLPGENEEEVETMKVFCMERGLILQRIRRYYLSDIASLSPELESERPLPCVDCNRIRLTADGKLKPCLFSDIEIPVDFSDIGASLSRAVQEKPKSGSSCILRENWQIGG